MTLDRLFDTTGSQNGSESERPCPRPLVRNHEHRRPTVGVYDLSP